jgi:predicted nucleic acid-binding protein
VSVCVIDANIAVKWFLDIKGEQLVDEALALLARHEKGEVQFVVPDLFWAELGNIFCKAVRLGRCSKADAERSLAVLQTSRLITISSRTLLEQAFEIASTFGRTMYDSLYVALASESGSELITADQKLVNALAGYFPVKWLGAI